MKNNIYNLNLYELGIKNDTDLIFKDEIIEYINENMNIQGDSEYSPGYISRNYYDPDEPEEVFLEGEGKLKLSVLESKFGELTENDIELLIYELQENQVFLDFLRESLESIKATQISDFELEIKEIEVKNQTLTINVEAINIEINN